MTENCDDKDGDCTDVLAEVYLLLDHECPMEHEVELRQHLDGCPDCLEQYGISEGLKQLLARKCGGDLAPDQLKERLLATIRKTVVERGVISTSEVTVEVRED